MAKIKKVGHVVLGVRDPQRSITFYTEALGMELVNVLEEMQMAFFSFGERDHDIALTKSVYFFDPDGNRLEIFSQEMTPVDGKQFLHDARAVADVMKPLDLETA